MRKILEVAFPALVANRTIERMVSQNELEYRFVCVVDHGGGCSHSHSFVDQGAARRLEFWHLFDLHEAHAAIGVRF